MFSNNMVKYSEKTCDWKSIYYKHHHYILISEFSTIDIEKYEPLGFRVDDPSDGPIRIYKNIKNIIDALNLAGVDIEYNGKTLESKHAPMLSTWFPEPYEKVYVEECNGNARNLICESKNTWTSIDYKTS